MKKSIRIISLILAMLLILTSTSFAAIDKQKIYPFKVAAVQFNPQLNERDKNVDALLTVVTEAAENGAKLIVTPEMSTTGYYYKDRDAIKPFVDTIPGITTQKFHKIARKYNTYIVVGMPEVDSETGTYYNSAALVGPEGYIGKYRKTHQWETEEHWAAWGDLGVPVYNTKIGKIAINICMDSAYFESARLAALNGADILAFPTNSSAQAVAALQARAAQNGLYIISANRSNTENGFHMIGASAVWSPEGTKLVEAKYVPTKDQDINEPTIVYATVYPSNYNNDAKNRLKERRPEVYKDLMLYISPWDYTKETVSNNVTAATIQYEPIIGDKNANMIKVKKLIDEAVSKANAQDKKLNLVVLPELSVTGPVNDVNSANQLAEGFYDFTTNNFSEIARANNLNIVFGMIEKESDKLYNCAVLIGQNGEMLGKYRKIHLDSYDKSWAKAGNKAGIFSSKLGKIGIMIGYDAAFPELSGVMAVNRADIIAVPSSWNGQFGKEIEINGSISANRYPEGSMCIWDSIAMSAQAYTIVSNYIGTEYNYKGRSALYTLDPLYGLDQPVVASMDKEESLLLNFTTIQSGWWFNQEKLISTRRTYFYKPLVR